MTTTTADATALLAACALHPDDDTPRLLLADCLDEVEARYVRCPKCTPTFRAGHGTIRTEHGKGLGWLLAGQPGARFHVPCDICSSNPRSNGGILNDDNKGSGEIPDPTVAALKDRAELIRVQCELARHEPCPRCVAAHKRHVGPGKGICHDKAGRIITASQLLAKHPEWRPMCPECNGGDKEEYARGGCKLCKDWGRVGALERGLLGCVPVPALGTVMRQKGNEWEPTPWASRVFADPWNRCARVECGDRVPDEEVGHETGMFKGKLTYDWNELTPAMDREDLLPPPLFRLLCELFPERVVRTRGTPVFESATAADATLALSLAVGAWLRKRVSLEQVRT